MKDEKEIERAFREAYGKAFQELRESRALTQTQLAFPMGEWPANINNIEQGRGWTPSLWALQRFLAQMGATWEEFGRFMDKHVPPEAIDPRPKEPSEALLRHMEKQKERLAEWHEERKRKSNKSGEKRKRKPRSPKQVFTQLTAEQRREIWERYKAGTLGTYREEGERYGVSRTTIGNIIRKMREQEG